MESNLPHCLKDCLGGNSKTFFLFAVRSEVSEYRQTLHTLNLAKEMQGVCNRRRLNAFPLGNRAFRLKAMERDPAHESADDVLTIPSEYASNLVAAVQSEEEKFKDDLKREISKANLLGDDDDLPATKTDVVANTAEEVEVEVEEHNVSSSSVAEEPPMLSAEVQPLVSTESETIEEEEPVSPVVEEEEEEEEVNHCNEIETQTDPDPDNLQEYVQILLADKTAKEKEIELLKHQMDEMRRLFDGAKEKLESIASSATVSSTPLENGCGGVTFSIANTNKKSDSDEGCDDSLISANIHVSDLSFSNSLTFSDGSDSSKRPDEGKLLRMSDAAQADSAEVYSAVISPVVQLVNLKIEVLEQLMKDFHLLSRNGCGLTPAFNFNMNTNVANVTDYDEQSVVCFQSAHASEIILAVNTELTALRRSNRSLSDEILALQSAEANNLKTIADLRDLLSSGDIREPNLEQEEEINALKIQAEANAKIIAELESLLAAYRQPPVQPDNSGTLTFANIRFSSSQLLLSSSSPDGSKSRSEEKLGEQTLSNQLSLARFTEAASVESANAAYTTVVQYPMGLVDGLSPALHQRQSPLRLSDPTATDTLSIGDDNESNRGVIRLLAMPEEELQAVIKEVNQQLRKKDHRFVSVACVASTENDSAAVLKLSQYVESSNFISTILESSVIFIYEVFYCYISHYSFAAYTYRIKML